MTSFIPQPEWPSVKVIFQLESYHHGPVRDKTGDKRVVARIINLSYPEQVDRRHKASRQKSVCCKMLID